MFDESFLNDIAKEIEDTSDREFFLRVWNTDLQIFKDRLNRLGFNEKKKILDAGCGFGQWTICLADQVDSEVVAIDIDPTRVQIAKKIANHVGRKKINFFEGSIDNLPFSDNYFDGIFCYSSIYYTNFKKTLLEFYRVLKNDGKLYFCTNGLGWYIHNIINRPNCTDGFDPRNMAINVINNSILYYNYNIYRNFELVMPSTIVIDKMKEIGYKNILYDPEGKINLTNENDNLSFFKGEYHGVEGVYEILSAK